MLTAVPRKALWHLTETIPAGTEKTINNRSAGQGPTELDPCVCVLARD